MSDIETDESSCQETELELTIKLDTLPEKGVLRRDMENQEAE